MDCIDGIKLLDDESIDCVITSPPYWQLRDYGHDKQIGLEPTFQEYVNNLADIFDDLKRVLKKDGTCFVVLGDTYSGNKKGKTDLKIQYIPNQKISKKETTLPNKSLCNIPSRFAIEMQDRGWILRNEIIWHKPNAMPSSVKDRFTIDFEKVFFFVKSQKYYFNQIKEPMLTTDTTPPRGSKEVIGNLNGGRRKQDEVGRNDYKGFNARYEAPKDLMRNKRTVWTIPTQANNVEHFAMFPDKLVEIMINAGCKPQGIVLDPFMGSGTTGIVAKKNNRNYIGFDLNAKYVKVADKRIAKVVWQTSIFTDFDNVGEDYGTGEELTQ